jgi:hypothetical protein
VILRLVRNAVSKTCKGEINTKNRAGGDECEEVSIIAAAHAVVEPDTVMIQGLDTVIAYSTVIAPWWPPNVAGLAVLDWNIHGGSLRVRQSDHHPVVRRWPNCQSVLIRTFWWKWVQLSRKDPRVHYRCVNE